VVRLTCSWATIRIKGWCWATVV